MSDLLIQAPNSHEQKFTSKFLVEQINLFRKEEGNELELLHKNLLVKIEKEFEEEINGLNIQPVEVKDSKGEMRKAYELDFEQSLQILMSESKLVRKRCVQIMQKQQAKIEYFKVPTNFKEALLLAVEQQEVIEKQNMILLEQKPKVDFYDEVASTTSSFDFQETSAMLKLGYGRNKLFQKLRDCKVLMSDNLPYVQHINSELFIIVESKWVNPKNQSVTAVKQTRCTQKGLEWLSKNKTNFNL